MSKINKITSAKPKQETIVKTINQIVDRLNKDSDTKKKVRAAIGKLNMSDMGLDDVTPVNKKKKTVKKKR